jgi:hypothetical protein
MRELSGVAVYLLGHCSVPDTRLSQSQLRDKTMFVKAMPSPFGKIDLARFVAEVFDNSRHSHPVLLKKGDWHGGCKTPRKSNNV